jgi:hypothetical protein
VIFLSARRDLASPAPLGEQAATDLTIVLDTGTGRREWLGDT